MRPPEWQFLIDQKSRNRLFAFTGKLHRAVEAVGELHGDIARSAIRDRIRSAGGLEPDAMTIRGFIDALRAEPLLGLRWGLLDNVASKPQDAYTRLQLTELIESMVPQDGRI